MKYSYPILALFSICNLLADRGMLAQVSSNSGSITGTSNQYNTGQPVAKAFSGQSSPSLKGNGLCFTPNKGQIVDMAGEFCPDVLYKGNGAGADIYLRKNGISYVHNNLDRIMHEVQEQIEDMEKTANPAAISLQEKKQELMQKQALKIHRVDMDFAGANTDCRLVNDHEVEGYTNYYYAHCPQGITNIKQYNKVTCKNIYNNIDVTYYGDRETGIKYDIIVQPNADPNQIKLHWKGVESININRDGSLIISTTVNEFYESMPKVYQKIEGRIIDVKARYVLNRTTVGFELDTWNKEFPLIIDPWATYYGSDVVDISMAVATDANSNVIFTGYTYSQLFPLSVGAFQTTSMGIDAFVVKLDINGSRVFATFIGGSSTDQGYGISTDAAGNICAAGSTTSANFPVGASGSNIVHQNTYGAGTNGGNCAFAFKFDPAGLRLWGTYYGGNVLGSTTEGNCIASDGTNIILGGQTKATSGISTAGSFQPVISGPQDAYVVKFAANGGRIWGTYIGGTNTEVCASIACTTTGDICVGGASTSTDFPVSAGAYQIANGGGGNEDAFIFKLTPTGARIWATYFGGPGRDGNWAGIHSHVVSDSADNIILSGVTNSTSGIAKPGAYQTAFGGNTIDGFVAKFSKSGVLQWATYLGGNRADFVVSCVIDAADNIYACGECEEDNMGTYPISTCAYQPTFGGVEDQFITKLDPNGKLICTTYLGGADEDDLDDMRTSIAIQGNNLYIVGCTKGNYPVTAGAFQTNQAGLWDVFVTQICLNICEGKILGLNFTAGSTTTCTNTLVPFTPTINYSCDTSKYKYKWTFTGATPSSSIAAKPNIIYTTPGSYPVKLILTTPCKKDSITKTTYITVNSCSCTMSATTVVAANETCSGSVNGSATVNISNGSGGPYTYTWSNGVSGTTTGTTIPVVGLSAGTYTITITEGSCASISTVTIAQQNTLNINSISKINVTCFGGSDGSATVTISGSSGGPYTYNWSNGISTITTSTTQPLNNLSSGNYTVTITQSSCKAISIVTITQPLPLTIGFSSQYSCLTNSGTITTFSANGNSPYSYLWSNGQTSSVATGLSLGTTYTITVTDANGCTATNAASPIIFPVSMNITTTNNSCTTTGSATVAVTGGDMPFSYNWNTGQTSSSIGGLLAGGYTLTVTDSNGCTATKAVTITGVNPVSATFTNSSTSCQGTSVTFINTGTPPGTGVSYMWSVGLSQGGFPITSGTTTDFSYTFLTAGSYSISHTVYSGSCNSTVTTNITIINCNGPTVTATGNSICNGSCATVTSDGSEGTKPYTYSWSNGASTQNINPCPSSTTTYTVTIKDGGGNTATSTAIVTINPTVSVSITATNITCNGSTNGNAIANAGSGTPPYNYSWNNGQTTQTATGLSAGNYTLTITDSKSCTAANTVAIISPPVLSGQFTKGTANCAACGCKEWIIVNAVGGTSPYSYSWPDGYVNRYKNQLCPGNYTVNIKDKNGCSINVNLSTP